MEKHFVPLFVILLISSCVNMNDPTRQAEYIQTFKTYNPSLTTHIPGKIPNNMVGYGFSSNIKGNYSHFYIKTKESSKKLFFYKKEISKCAK